jgi:hypothetical protein
VAGGTLFARDGGAGDVFAARRFGRRRNCRHGAMEVQRTLAAECEAEILGLAGFRIIKPDGASQSNYYPQHTRKTYKHLSNCCISHLMV